ncbi:hypothetical protein scyTo_0007951 [Scyliorhinus torazame]|uniref:Uncharacterized protein n=1 Tax=Scyliorhinus torazame TaxID=75743 RepID=A0A401P160_SCYTO|nr:hypothetical protein [Scyliorhinus torazame]
MQTLILKTHGSCRPYLGQDERFAHRAFTHVVLFNVEVLCQFLTRLGKGDRSKIRLEINRHPMAALPTNWLCLS